ncbi:GNAT family N-acetyltransferase [Rossellomorea sp. AcN35-11]|nr:GNAT family N-acetyltransferase [Rossellomorea aquimaris]WJV28759.1 GNAT family N-acetyltransferase [Rossellomorea sp. AcN35-11]
MKIMIQNRFDPDQVGEIKEIYHSVGWKKHSDEAIEKVFIRSDILSLAICCGKVVGVGRALTDGVFNATIYDVVVHREYQGNGIASLIMDDLLKKLQEISCVLLISTTGNEEFYKKHGLKKVKTGMARYLNSKLADEYLE